MGPLPAASASAYTSNLECLLDGYGRAKNYTAALQTWSAAIKQAAADPSSDKLPDEQMYTTMINVHFRAKKIDEA